MKKRSRVSTVTAVALGAIFALGLAFAAGAQPDRGEWLEVVTTFDEGSETWSVDSPEGYEIIGTEGSWGDSPPNYIEAAFDGNFDTFFDAPTGDPAFLGLDLGEPKEITGIRYAPRDGFADRGVGATIQGANEPDLSDAQVLMTIEEAQTPGQWNTFNIDHGEPFRYVFYEGSPDAHTDIAGIEFYGLDAEPTPYAADFDGDSGIVVADGPAVSSQSEQFSVMMWVKGPAGQADKRVFSEGSFSNSNPLFNIGTDNNAETGQLDIYYRGDDGGTFINHGKSEGEPFDGTWHHVAVVVDNGTLSMYIDGEQDPTVLEFDPGLISVENTSIAGIQREDPSHWFEGSIAHVGVFSRALGGAEIQRYMNQELRGSESGLEAYWPLGEGEGETANDLSVNAFDGDMQGGFEWVQAPDLPVEPAAEAPMPDELTRGAALDLNGDGQYVEADVTAGDLGIAGNAPKTMEGWAYTRTFDNNGGLLNMGAPGADGEDFALRVTGTDDVWRAQLWGGFDIDFEYPSQNQWVHFAVVHTGSETIIYANGELVASQEQEIETSAAEPFRVGWWPNRGESDTFDGMVAEVRVWDFARPQAAIMADMGERLTGNEDGLLLHWPLDENEGDTAFDSSPNNNDGTIVGGPEWVSEEVPNLAGLHWEEAATTLEEAGFQVYIDYVELGEVENGQVHAQAPGAGQTSAPGWTVVLQVESEPQSFAPATPAWLMLIVMTGLLSVAGLRMRKGLCVS